jgi:hypothetical protein
MCDRVLSVTLALGTSATVAAWSIWQQYSKVWAIIIGLAQVAAIARPYFPFLKNEHKFLSVSFELETVYIRLVRLWYSFKKDSDEQPIEKSFDELTDKWLEIEKHALQFPKIKLWIDRIDREKVAELRIDFPKMTL